MAIKDRTMLKGVFENGDIPDQDDFGDLIDSQANLLGNNTSIGDWNISGDVTINGRLSATIISATYIDIKYYEISGFSINGGNLTMNGGNIVMSGGDILLSTGSLINDITTIASASAGWNSTQTTVVNNSASWSMQSDLTELAAASGGWNSTQTTVVNNSASWSMQSDLTELAAASGGWNSTQTTVVNNSASWSMQSDLTELATASGGWNSTRTTVNTNSSRWFQRPTIIVNTVSYNVPINESGTTYVVSANPGGGNVDFILPNAGISHLGIYYTFVKYTSSTMITLSADVNHRITDSGYGATFYSGSGTSSVSAQEFASCEVQLVLPDIWHINTGRKIWTTTEWV